MSITTDFSKYESGYSITEIQAILEKNYPDQQNHQNWIVQTSSLGGRGLFACRKIEKGELIFKNSPIAIGLRDEETDRGFCAYCYETDDEYRTCEKCGQVMCIEICYGSHMHLTECEFITNYWKSKSNSKSISQIFRQMRIHLQLFLSTNDQKQLMFILQHDRHAMFKDLEQIYASFSIPDEHIEFMKAVNSILKINTFRIPSNSREKEVPLRGLYPLAAFMNHSCVPNTRNVFKKDKTMEVYATRDIDIGEEILTCYTSLLWCTPIRRYQLYQSKNFWCQCSRCDDPTEMGTKLSALKCFAPNCVGEMLPCKPLYAMSEWGCYICRVEVSAKQVKIIQSIVGSLVKLIHDEGKIDVDNIVLKRLECFLPPSNHIFVDLHFRWALKLGYDGDATLNGILDHLRPINVVLLQANVTNIKANKTSYHLRNE